MDTIWYSQYKMAIIYQTGLISNAFSWKKNLLYFYLIQISYQFVPKGLVADKNSTLVQVLGWYQTGGKLLPEPMISSQICQENNNDLIHFWRTSFSNLKVRSMMGLHPHGIETITNIHNSTYWVQDKMAHILQMKFRKVFGWKLPNLTEISRILVPKGNKSALVLAVQNDTVT